MAERSTRVAVIVFMVLLAFVLVVIGVIIFRAPSAREQCEAEGGRFTDSTWSTSCEYPRG